MRIACPRLRASYYLHARTYHRLSLYHPRRRERPCPMVARSGTRCCHFVTIAIAATDMHACDRPSLYCIHHHPRFKAPWMRFNFHGINKVHSYNPTISTSINTSARIWEYVGNRQSLASTGKNGRKQRRPVREVQNDGHDRRAVDREKACAGGRCARVNNMTPLVAGMLCTFAMMAI